jgi:hypothetical protein
MAWPAPERPARRGCSKVGQLTVVDVTDDPDWDAAVWQQPGANLYASRRWGEYKSCIGWDRAGRSGAGQAMACLTLMSKGRATAPSSILKPICQINHGRSG